MGTTPGKGQADFWAEGDWNAICAQCGRKRKASMMVKNPPGTPCSGMYTCPEHYDSRQPQDFVKGIVDKMTAPWTQQIGMTFLYTCDLQTRAAIPGAGVSGCMQAGYVPANFSELWNGWVA